MTTPHDRTLRCLYCGKARPLGARCPGCDVEPPRAPCAACGRILVEPMEHCECGAMRVVWAETPACARCQSRLLRAPIHGTTAHIESCSPCGGSFVRTEDMAELIVRAEAGEVLTVPLATGGTPYRGDVTAAPDLLAIVSCPHCAREMDRARFAQRASLVIDVCVLHGMWLDPGELASLLRFVADRARGHAQPGDIERADEEKWQKLVAQRSAEEAEVTSHVAMARSYLTRNNRGGGFDT